MVGQALATVLLTITLSAEGHWLADQPGTIEVAWAAPDHGVDAALRWRLALGSLPIDEGELELAGDEQAAELVLTPPTVRVRTTLRWVYALHAADDDRLLERGEQMLHLYPGGELVRVAERLSEPVVVLADEDASLLAALRDAGVPHRRVARAAALQLDPPRFVLVAPGRLADTPNESEALRQLAQGGAGVMVFEQPGLDRLMGYRLRRRPVPDRLVWRDGHALLAGFSAADRASWLTSAAEVRAIELPVDEPGLELAYWPREIEALEPAPTDALVVTRTVGRGRIVLWQVPLGPWDEDPRSQRLLVNALDYLGTRPGPTPALADRPDERVKAAPADRGDAPQEDTTPADELSAPRNRR